MIGKRPESNGGISMRRLMAVIISAVLLFSAAGAFASENQDLDVYSYDFDLRFHLDAEGFQPRIRSHIRGYAELLDMLSLKGNLTWSSETGSMDLNLNIIPLTNPSAAVSMHFFGIPEHICMTSSLIGNETIWFNNFVLMEFALKSWNNLHIPLQYIALLFPYVTENAFHQLTADWKETIGTVTKSQKIQKNKLKKISDLWSRTLQEDQRLIYWITGLSVLSDDHLILENEINKLPEYLLQNVAVNRDLTVRVEGDTIKWMNQDKLVLYEASSGGDSWAYTLPLTDNGYAPALSYSSASSDGLSDISIIGSYHLQDGENADTGETEGIPSSLLDFRLGIHSIPEKWPVNSSFSADLEVIGSVLPNFDIQIRGATKESGDFSISVNNLADGSADSAGILTCSGTFIPVEPQAVPAYNAADLTRHFNVFSVNDKTVSDFSQKIRRPLITGILNFLDEVPASACQSVMDDMEEYGLLNLLLGEE